MPWGWPFSSGYGVEQDETKAVELFRQSHEAGFPAGTCSLGLCYELLSATTPLPNS